MSAPAHRFEPSLGVFARGRPAPVLAGPRREPALARADQGDGPRGGGGAAAADHRGPGSAGLADLGRRPSRRAAVTNRHLVPISSELILHPFFDHGGVDKGLFWHALTSLKRVAIGFSFSAVVGVALGVLVGANRWAHRGLDPIFQVLRTVPPLAWLPLSLAAFHEAQPSALFVIFITSIWPIVINTAVGVRNIPPDYINVSRVLKLSPLEFFIKILLPSATPYIFTGLRIGVGMSWLAIIASEMLLGGVGVGFFIWDQYNSSRISDIIVALVWVGMVGFALDRFIAFLGRLVSRGASAS